MIKLLKPVRLFNILLCFLGIRTKVIDFQSEIENKHQNVVRDRLKYYLKFLPFIFCVAFLFKYPLITSRILSNMPYGVNGKRTVDYFIAYAYFNVRFAVLIIIYIFQYYNKRSIEEEQSKIERNFYRLWEINKYWQKNANFYSNGTKFPKANICSSSKQILTQASINSLSNIHLIRILLFLTIYVIFNLTNIHFASGFEDLYVNELIWYFYPKAFINFFIWQLSISVQQQSKLFELLNNTIEMVATDMHNQIASRSYDENCVNDLWAVHCTAAINKRQLQLHRMNSHIEKLIEIHDELRASATTFQQFNSIQVTALIVNGLVNVISKVSILILLLLFICDLCI